MSKQLEELENPVGGEIGDAVEQILAELGKGPVGGKIVIRVGRHKLYFREPSPDGELDRFREQAIGFMRAVDAASESPFGLAAAGLGSKELLFAFTIHYYSTEPTPISQLQAMKMAQNATVMEMIAGHLGAAVHRGLMVSLYDEVEVEKKDLKPTGRAGRSYRSRKKSTASIRTI